MFNKALFLRPEVFGEVTLARKKDFESDLLAKLELCCQSIGKEYINAVRFEDEDQNDPQFQNAMAINSHVQIDPDTLSIWKADHVRLFISHRDKHKAEANVLALLLEEYGVSSFVAHDTIQPMTTWQSEIIKGLETMEVMLVYLTDDFHDSVWTNQEVGYALGRNIPVISLKLGVSDPRGFIGERQALKKHSSPMAEIASDIYELIVKRLGDNTRFQSALISAFCESPDFTEAKNRFNRMRKLVTTLTDDEVDRVIKSFHENSQLYNSAYLVNHNNRLINFLNRVSAKTYERSGRDIYLKWT